MKQRTCPKCGSMLFGDELFCNNCRRDLDNPPQRSADTQFAPQAKMVNKKDPVSRLLLAAIFFCMLAVVGMQFYGVHKGKGTESENAAEASSAQAAAQTENSDAAQTDDLSERKLKTGSKEEIDIVLDRYKQIEIGQTYAEVCSCMGAPGLENTIPGGGPLDKDLRWNSPSGQLVTLVLLRDDSVKFKCMRWNSMEMLPLKNEVAESKFADIRLGLSYKDVCSKLGADGVICCTAMGEKGKIYSLYAWKSASAPTVIKFQDGKVVNKFDSGFVLEQ